MIGKQMIDDIDRVALSPGLFYNQLSIVGGSVSLFEVVSKLIWATKNTTFFTKNTKKLLLTFNM